MEQIDKTQCRGFSQQAPSGDRSLLIVDDDKPFAARLARAMEARGFVVEAAGSVAEGRGDRRRRARFRRDRPQACATAAASTSSAR